MAREGAELPVIQACYDFTVWLLPKLGKLPRDLRFTLGEKIERLTLCILEGLIRARYAPQRGPILDDVNVDLEVLRYLIRVASECGWKSLRDMTRQPLERWLAQRTEAGMSARSRNAHLSSLVSFANWCTDNGRLTLNPLTRIAKANEKADPRRQRRALTEGEVNRLILVARWRPLAEHGRESLADAGSPGMPRQRSNWSKAELTLEGLEEAVSLARMRLADNPELIETLDRLGRERALIVKTLVLTGLRKSELGSLTVGQAVLDGSLPCLILNAADEKNRQGSTIPLRAVWSRT